MFQCKTGPVQQPTTAPRLQQTPRSKCHSLQCPTIVFAWLPWAHSGPPPEQHAWCCRQQNWSKRGEMSRVCLDIANLRPGCPHKDVKQTCNFEQNHVLWVTTLSSIDYSGIKIALYLYWSEQLLCTRELYLFSRPDELSLLPYRGLKNMYEPLKPPLRLPIARPVVQADLLWCRQMSRCRPLFIIADRAISIQSIIKDLCNFMLKTH